MRKLHVNDSVNGDSVIPLKDFKIPDLWHIAMEFKDAGNIPAFEAVLNTWQFAHEAKDALNI